MLKNFVRILGGDPNKRILERLIQTVTQVNTLEPQFEKLSDEALRAKTDEFRAKIAQQTQGITDPAARRAAQQQGLEDILPEAFATVREASKRTIGLRHYDVQLIGGMVLHQGKISEMRTGEGKTLVATLPLYLNALLGRGVHLITVNDFLARRDARWKAPIYNLLGLSVGVLQMAARTENGKNGFLIDLSKTSPHEDQHQLVIVPRREAYAADITYGTNSEFGFDYLRDNMTYSLDDRVQRGHYYAIVDEVDNVLIDEARTPLIISGPASENVEEYNRMAQIVRQLRVEDYEISERDRNITLSEAGEIHVEELLGAPLRDPDRPEDVTPEQARLLGYLEQALRAQFLFRRNKEYIVQGGKVIIVDEFTGRMMPGRRWSDGLHQAVEAKEGVKVEAESVTYATITLQNYFRMYQKLAGMSGTALTEAEEFSKIYKLEVLPIPTNLEYNASRPDSPLIELETKDDQGYKFRYYAVRDDPAKTPRYYRRKDHPDVIYRTEEAKFRAIVTEVLRNHSMGRPILIGTTSVELSEQLSARLRAEPLRRLAQIKLLRDAWFIQNKQEEDGRTFAPLKFLNDPLEKLDIADIRKMARELEISANPEEPANVERLLSILGLTPDHLPRLRAALQGGVAHQVLNARKHAEESQIIAGAGGLGAVTIATNMAGRGVDIKLGGELAEEHLAVINRVLKRAGHADPYDMTDEQRRAALKQMPPSEWGIYETEVQMFLQHLDDMEMVKTLGGLHVIGSERHEARRIDNQLRGRAARQGDPGASRFYLSLEDELMRRFGGDQARSMMERFQIDDAMPLEYGIVSRIVESAQSRVEGANFDVRKHLLEYDDVLNKQRAAIYEQRDRVFLKEDLHGDVADMFEAELKRRVPEALNDPEGPWKLIAWLEQVQPSTPVGNTLLLSYGARILTDELMREQPADRAAWAERLTDLAAQAIEAEDEHLLKTLQETIRLAEKRLDDHRRERREALDTFIEGLNLGEEEQPRSPRELAEELSSMLRLPLRLSPDQQRALRDNPRQFAKGLRPAIEAGIVEQNIQRLLGALERRLPERLEAEPAGFAAQGWDDAIQQITERVEAILQRRRERLIGPNGAIRREAEERLGRLTLPVPANTAAQLLLASTQSVQASFDKRTHRRLEMRSQRYNLIFLAARRIENQSAEDLIQAILAHLETIRLANQRLWGQSELTRLSAARLVDLDQRSQQRLRVALGVEIAQRAADQPLGTLEPEDRQRLAECLGNLTLNEIYRKLLLGVITDLWIDYLTQMEALRIAITLESYAQRDPLVQYKAKASELYQELIRNTRLGVISRMFLFRPRETSAVQTTSGGVESSEDAPAGSAGNLTSEADAAENAKRKRHRRR